MGYPILIGLALFLGFAPFIPEPHLVQKLKMVANRTLTRPIDIFDLLLHLAPILLLLTKISADLVRLNN